MRILHVTGSLEQKAGGPVRALLDLSARAFAHGLHSEIVGFGPFNIPDNPLPREYIHALPVQFPRRYWYSRQARSWARKNLPRYDGIVLHTPWLYPNWVFAQEAARMRIPYACFPHGMVEPWPVYKQGPWKALKKALYWQTRERWIWARAKCIFFTTAREMDRARATFTISHRSLIVIPYGVDVITRKIELPENRSLTQADDRQIALFLGRLHPKKNVELLIEAWAAAKTPGCWHLVIAGPGEPNYVGRIRALIERRGLAAHVHLFDLVTGRDKEYLLSRADWFLLPSRHENFGIAVLEAMGRECAVAVSNEVHIAEYFHDDSVVLPLELESWTRFMRTGMLDPRLRKRIVELDGRLVLPKFGVEKVAADWARALSRGLGLATE
jgi:glycosyltransferase involved in cell wall biosynthesis